MLAPGTRVHRFVIDRLLGKGGMAEVYAARDTHLRRLVALKRLRSERDDASTARLLREARAAASFQHACAVAVYDVFEHDGCAYMAMELVSGRTMRSYVGDASIPVERRLRWLIDVARALGAAHRAGLVHRDVKPHNVMVRDDGMIKVLDFGIARSYARAQASADDVPTLGTLTEAGAIVGTPLYASPEQLSALPVDQRSDQFGWGVMGYELCCGLLPWRRRDTLSMLAQLVSNDVPTMAERVAEASSAHREAGAQAAMARAGAERLSDAPSVPPPPGPALYVDLPPEVEPVLLRAMAREPAERFETIDDAADLLEDFAEPPPSLRNIGRTSPASDGTSDPLARSGGTPAAAGGSTFPGARPAQEGEALASGGSARSGRAAPGSARGAAELAPPASRTPASLRGDAPPEDLAPPSEDGPTSDEPLSSSPDPSSATPTALSAFAATPPPDGGRTVPIAPPAAVAPERPERRESSPPEEERPLFRRSTVLIGSLALGAAAAVAVATSWSDRGSTVAPSPSSSAATAPAVARVACAPAEVASAPPPIDAASAPALFGQAACVRLAVALGVPWDPPGAAAPGATPLAVKIDGAQPSRATLTLAGRTTSAEAPLPLAAVRDAARALASMLAPPAINKERQVELGAPGDEAARRVDALLRARDARLDPDPSAALSEVIALAPSSPWPRLLVLQDAAGAQAQAIRAQVLASAAELPGAFAETARGLALLRAPAADTDREDAAAALRRAYAARPDDGLVAAGLVEAVLAAGLFEEAAAAGMRIADRAPAESLAPLAVLARSGPPDPAWLELRGRALDRLESLLPEARGWDTRALHEALSGHVDAAKGSLALGDALGLPSAIGRGWARDLTRAAVAVAEDRPAAARALAQPFVGSPSAPEADVAARLLVQAHLLEGNTAAAETALARDIARLGALGDTVRATERWITLLGIRRRLDQPPSEIADVKKLEEVLPAVEALHSPLAPALRVETFLVQLARKEKGPADAAAVKEAIEAYARKVARHDRTLQDDLAIQTLPLAMVTGGLAGLRAAWPTFAHARLSAKLPYLFIYGLASEKAGADDEAERAYRTVASSPLAVDGLEHLAARFRLARLLQRLGRKEEAAKWKGSTDRILSGADRGVVEALDRDL